MNWSGAFPALVAAVAILLGPGLGLGCLLGARGFRLLACAPAGTMFSLGLLAVLGQMIGVPWRPGWTALLVTLAGAVIFVTGRRLGNWSEARSPSEMKQGLRGWVAALWAASALVMGSRLVSIIGSPENIAQAHDNAFHLNAVQFVVQSGHGSSLTLGNLGTRRGESYYPGAWHDYVALIVETTGVAIPVAVNLANIAIAAVAWTGGVIFLATRTAGLSRVSASIGALLALSFGTFPYLFFNFGVVWPWFTAICLLPATLGLAIELLGLGFTGPARPVPTALLLGTSLAGVALTHPGVLVGGLGLCAPLVITWWRRAPKGAQGRRRLTVMLYFLASAIAWYAVRPARVSNWDNFGDPYTAVVRAIMVAPTGGAIPWLLVAMLFTSLFTLLQTPERIWTLALFLVGVLLYVGTQLPGLPTIRYWVSGVWYGDPYRAASFLPVVMIPLLMVGACGVVAILRDHASTAVDERPAKWKVACAVVACACFVALAPGSSAVRETIALARGANRFTAGSALLSHDEQTLLRRLPRHVPRDAMVAGDPKTGAALVYAYTGREALEPFPGLVRGQAGSIIAEDLNQIDVLSRVCTAVRTLGVGYVLDFGDRSIDGGVSRVPGYRNLISEPGFKLVDQQGQARLFQIVGCRT